MRKNSKTNHILWALIAILFGILLSVIATNSIGYEPINQLDVTKTNTTENAQQIANSPKNFYYIKDPSKKLNIKAESYFVGDLDTGEMILEKNKDGAFPIASISKLSLIHI